MVIASMTLVVVLLMVPAFLLKETIVHIQKVNTQPGPLAQSVAHLIADSGSQVQIPARLHKISGY